jgi:hypothetical protein
MVEDDVGLRHEAFAHVLRRERVELVLCLDRKPRLGEDDTRVDAAATGACQLVNGRSDELHAQPGEQIIPIAGGSLAELWLVEDASKLQRQLGSSFRTRLCKMWS